MDATVREHSRQEFCALDAIRREIVRGVRQAFGVTKQKDDHRASP
jgi:hypothetical protein